MVSEGQTTHQRSNGMAKGKGDPEMESVGLESRVRGRTSRELPEELRLSWLSKLPKIPWLKQGRDKIHTQVSQIWCSYH